MVKTVDVYKLAIDLDIVPKNFDVYSFVNQNFEHVIEQINKKLGPGKCCFKTDDGHCITAVSSHDGSKGIGTMCRFDWVKDCPLNPNNIKQIRKKKNAIKTLLSVSKKR